MTDSTDDRLAALAARGRGPKATAKVLHPADPAGPPKSAASPHRRKRQPHRAAGGRILATGLSVGAALLMAGAMASTRQPATGAKGPIAQVAQASARQPVVVRVVMTDGTAATPEATSAAVKAVKTGTLTPVVRRAPETARATATSRGS